MCRRNWLAGAMLVALALGGCGGKVEGDVQVGDGPGSTTSFGGQKQRAYFGMTNTFETRGAPALVSFDLLAGARVELEVVTRDGSPLELELHRVRHDGTIEMLEHVHVTSGFHLETFEAPSPNEYELYFPSRDRTPQTIVVHLGCKDGSSYGRCTPAGQPGDTCSKVYPCDEGLACSIAPNAFFEQGTCAVASDADEPR